MCCVYDGLEPHNHIRIPSPLLSLPWRWSGPSIQVWMPTYVSILRIPQMIWVLTATVEWYWQGKTVELGQKPVPVPLCPPQIPHGLTRTRTLVSAVRGQRLTTWTMARPAHHKFLTISQSVDCMTRLWCPPAYGFITLDRANVQMNRRLYRLWIRK
jgi:hypothetical protein